MATAKNTTRKQSSLSVRKLRKLLSYNPDTGAFTWAVDRGVSTRAGTAAGSKHPQGHVVIGVAGRVYLAHRLAWFWMTGKWPDFSIGHANGDRADNRFGNLCPIGQLPSASSDGDGSGVRGVSRNAGRGRWDVEIVVGGTAYRTSFSDAECDGNSRASLMAANAFARAFRPAVKRVLLAHQA